MCIKEEVSGEIKKKKKLELSGDENITYQYLWNVETRSAYKKIVALNASIRKEDLKSVISASILGN